MSGARGEDRFYQDFLSELAGLDRFLGERERARGLDPEGIRVGRADPDLRRLLEALAYFSARSQAMARRGMFDAVSLLARDALEALTCPVPAAGLVALTPQPALFEPAYLPPGTAMKLSALDGTQALFVTAREVTLWPLRVRAARYVRSGSKLALGIELESSIELTDKLGELDFFVDCYSDLRESLRLRHWLSRALSRASVTFGRGLPQDLEPAIGSELACEVRFGATDDAPSSALGPLFRVRSELHAPEQGLFLRVRLPPSGARGNRLVLWFELGSGSAPLPPIGPETFRPFVLPIVNWIEAPAQPIVCDGTREHYPVRFSGDAGAQGTARHALPTYLQSIRGVYELTPNGLFPLRSGCLGDPARTYAVTEDGGDPARTETRLRLELPGSVEKPKRIEVRAVWHQPDFDAGALGKIAVRPLTRQIDGVAWEVLGTIRRHRLSPLGADPFALLEILSLRTRDSFDRDEIRVLLELLGADSGGPYRGGVELIERVRVEEELIPGGGAGAVRRVYGVWVKDHEPSLRPLLEELLLKLEAALDAWGQHPVEVRLHAPEPNLARQSA